MAKITIDDIDSQFASTTAINSRFQQIEDELNNKVLYRNNPTGEANAMSNDLDMASNNILNGGAADFAGLTIAGVGVTPSSLVATPPAASITYDNSGSTLVAANVKAALDELDVKCETTIPATVTAVANDVADIRTTQGTSDGDTDLGTFTGSTITDNNTVKGALQELETESESQAADITALQAASGAVLAGYMGGFKLSNNGSDSDHDIDITAGNATDSTGAYYLTSAAATTSIDVAIGTGNGGFPSALTLSADTWYHLFIVSEADGTNPKFGFDTSITATNVLADWTAQAAGTYTLYRRLGSVLTDVSSNILAFNHVGDKFMWTAPIADYDTSGADPDLTSTPTSISLSVPPGVAVESILQVRKTQNANYRAYIYPTFRTTPTIDISFGTFSNVFGGSSDDEVTSAELNVLTNTSQNVNAAVNSGAHGIHIFTLGWTDYRE